MTGGKFLLGIAGVFLVRSAFALEFLSVNEPAAILYDAPSTKAQKLFVLSTGYPVEVVVKASSAEIRQGPTESSPVAFTAEKGVYLDLLELSAGWAKVRHRDGASGFVKVSQIWGL